MPTQKPKSNKKGLRNPKNLEAQKNLKKPSGSTPMVYLTYNF